ncbi:nuclear transport factor 2 family protein [Algoriphagus confluentis]
MKKSVLFILTLLPIFSFAQSQLEEEKKAIAATVQLYFEGMIERDAGKLEEAFLPDARLIGYRGDQLFVTPFEDWKAGTAKGSPRNPNDFKNELKNIKIVGEMALAETELFWPGIYYYDYLTLLKIEGKWKIVHKSWWERSLEK